MPETGILQSHAGALVMPAEGATVQIEGSPFSRYASFSIHLIDVDPLVQSLKGFDLKQCRVANRPEGHNKFNLQIFYRRPAEVENGRVTKTYPEVAVSGKVQWKAVGE